MWQRVRTVLHLYNKNIAPILSHLKVSQADLKTPAPSAVPMDHLTAEKVSVPTPSSLLSTDTRFLINGIIFNLSRTTT